MDLYNHGRRLQRKIARYEQSEEPNLAKIAEFSKYLIAENLSAARVLKYMVILGKISERLDKNFDSVTKKDIQDLVATINTSSYKEWTKTGYKVVIKRFWKWLKNSEEYPQEVKWIKTTCKSKNTISVKREDVLTPDEVVSMVESCTSIRDKALVMTLFESGLRVGELLTMQIKNVRFEQQGAYLSVTGKTGDKVVFVYLSTPLLSQWIAQHPLNDDPEAYLWISLNTLNHHGIISPMRLCAIVKESAHNAGVKKRVWSYLLRHSAATDDAKVMPHAVLCAKYGWTQGSKMPAVYVHLGAEDVKDAQLRKYGIALPQKDNQALVECPRCHQKSSPGIRYCSVCGLCIKPTTAAKLQAWELKKKDEVIELRKQVGELKDAVSQLLQGDQFASLSPQPS